MTSSAIASLERPLTRIAALVAIGGCALFVVTSPDHRAPRAALLAGLGIYALSKLVVLGLRVVSRQPMWVANLCELGALGVLGFVVWTNAMGLVTIILVVALLLAASAWRRRAAQLAESESP